MSWRRGTDVRAVDGGWVRSQGWDTLFLLSGLWLTPLVCVLAYRDGDPAKGSVNALYLVLSAALWIGHRLGSSYLAYCTAAYRPLLSSQPIRFVWAPLAIAGLLLAFLVPVGFWPWARADRVVAVAILDFGFITYHFASQHFGVLSLYRVRGGPKSTHTRAVDRGFALGIAGIVVFVADALGTDDFHQDVWLHPWLAESTRDHALDQVRVLGTGAVGLATLAFLRFEWFTAGRSAPRALYGLSVALLVLATFWLDPFVFLVLWTTQHWLAAIGLTLAIASTDRGTSPSHWVRRWQPVSLRPWLLLAVLATLSTLLLPFMEVEAVEVSERYGPAIFPDAWIAAIDRSPWLPWLVAFGFVTGFVHYQLDRAVFRFSDPAVREAGRSLWPPKL